MRFWNHKKKHTCNGKAEDDVTASDYFEEPVTMFSSHTFEFKPSLARVDWTTFNGEEEKQLPKYNKVFDVSMDGYDDPTSS